MAEEQNQAQNAPGEQQGSKAVPGVGPDQPDGGGNQPEGTLDRDEHNFNSGWDPQHNPQRSGASGSDQGQSK